MNFLRKQLVAVLILSIVLSLGSLCIFATETEIDTETEPPVELHTEDSVVIWAEEMQDKMNGPHPTSTFSFAEEDGRMLLKLSTKEETGDPFVSFDPVGFSADYYKYVGIIARAPTVRPKFTIYYNTDGSGPYSEKGKAVSSYADITDWQVIGFDFSEKENWSGMINKLRFDFFEGGKFPLECYVDIAAVIFCKSAEDLYDTSYELLTDFYAPKQILSDFTDADLPCFKANVSIAVFIQEGNLLLTAIGTSDPQTAFSYTKFTEVRGMDKLTTEDFRYTVFRYRTSLDIINRNMELFIYTGDRTSPMVRIKNTYTAHSGDEVYELSDDWRSVVIDLAEDDGLEINTELLYGWQGRGAFNGFRIDWCGQGVVDSYMEISDILFFADKDAARNFSATLNQLNNVLDKNKPVENQPEETTYDTRYDETQETVDVVMPWETETESETEETLPVFIEDTEVVTESETESVTEVETPVDTESQTESDTQPSDDETNNTQSGGDVGEIGGNETESEGEDDGGSQVPFFIACISLSCLSVASIVTVIVIRIKEKKENK